MGNRNGGSGVTAPRTCHICGTVTDTYCPTCTAHFASRRNAEVMTGEERAAELELLCGPLEIEFQLVHRRIEELVGRPVWTHEMGSSGMPGLLQEARTRVPRGDGPTA